MHPCLYVDEIVRVVAHELVASNGRATSVAFACCCKVLEDPVLDALWETQGGALPLLKSLPGDVWNEGGCAVSVSITCVLLSLSCLIQKSFKRPPTALEWARFRKYARRMRRLAIGDWGSLRDLSLEVLTVLQLQAINGLLFPNLKTLSVWGITEKLIPFLPLFISLRITAITFAFYGSNLPKVTVASMVATLRTLCPNLQNIYINPLPRDPIITAAVSEMLLASSRNTLRSVYVDSPLTEKACKAIYKHPDLHELSVVVERGASLPSAVLPNLTNLVVKYDHDGDWLPLFRGATLGRLEVVSFYNRSKRIGDFLEAFERVALAASIQNTLSQFYLYTSGSWNPNYSSLLPFTHLAYLVIEFSCDDGCSSRVDDDTITNLGRAMPKLDTLRLGDSPCHGIPTGATAKGFMVLADHCPDLRTLCVHFQVASLSAPPAVGGMIPNAGPTGGRRDCGLTDLEVGGISVAEGSVLAVAQTLVRIFPRIERFTGNADESWEEVMDTIRFSRLIVDYQGKGLLSTCQSDFDDTSPETVVLGD